MQRQIVMTEEELDVLINRAIYAGVRLRNRIPEVMHDMKLWQERRDKAREHLKSVTIPG